MCGFVRARVRAIVCAKYFLFSQRMKDIYESSIHISSQSTLCKGCTGGNRTMNKHLSVLLQSVPRAALIACALIQRDRGREEYVPPSECISNFEWLSMENSQMV